MCWGKETRPERLNILWSYWYELQDQTWGNVLSWNYVLCLELFCIILHLHPPSVFLYRRICLHHSPLSPHKSMASSISETCWAVPFSLPGNLDLKRPYDFLGHNFQVSRKYFILKGSPFLVVVVQLLSHVRLLVTPWTAACQTVLHCPSPSAGACPNSCPMSRWFHPTISSTVVLFSTCFLSFPASGSFPMSQLVTSGGLPCLKLSFSWLFLPALVSLVFLDKGIKTRKKWDYAKLKKKKKNLQGRENHFQNEKIMHWMEEDIYKWYIW